MSRYKTLRTWANLLRLIGVFSVMSATLGVTAWAIQVEGFWETVGVIFFGAPAVLMLATWPIALSQVMRALADIGDSVPPVGDPFAQATDARY